MIVKKTDLIFNEKECQMLNFMDITSFKKLEAVKETNKLLKALNASVHHEMINPLKANAEMCERLLKSLQSLQLPREERLAKNIYITN